MTEQNHVLELSGFLVADKDGASVKGTQGVHSKKGKPFLCRECGHIAGHIEHGALHIHTDHGDVIVRSGEFNCVSCNQHLKFYPDKKWLRDMMRLHK